VNGQGGGVTAFVKLVWQWLSVKLSGYMDRKTSGINHREVISELVQRSEMTEGYLSSILLANLVALLGLLTNSVAVVIGAMLISPLMGPIFSLGLAFTIRDLVLSRRALRTIVSSILLTVVVAALFTLLSPLKGTTPEILARTRPNVYDLLIAVFAGTAGALALCTRKNYLFTTTGVAVATAVIPPLSVVGYGLGTWQLGIAAGGFLLFFTNLVAIVISSDAVFYFYRFRGSMAAESAYPLRRRLRIMGGVLAVISIPLVITLVTDIRTVNLTRRTESVLKSRLNRQHHSRLTSVSIDASRPKLSVLASVNTVAYLDSAVRTRIEEQLAARIGRPVSLELEQVIVRSGAVEPPSPLRQLVPAAAPQPETLASLREKSMAHLRVGCREVETYIAPFRLAGCGVTFSDGERPISVQVAMLRDDQPGPQEQRWIRTVLEKKLQESIDLRVETLPLLPPPGFTEKDDLDKASRDSLSPLARIAAQLPEYGVQLEIPPDTRNSVATTRRRVASLKSCLVEELGIAADRITVVAGKGETIRVRFRR
jgi:uncharacterized hydrophobic protein (TIGR00271 family)